MHYDWSIQRKELYEVFDWLVEHALVVKRDRIPAKGNDL